MIRLEQKVRLTMITCCFQYKIYRGKPLTSGFQHAVVVCVNEGFRLGRFLGMKVTELSLEPEKNGRYNVEGRIALTERRLRRSTF